MSAVTIDRSEAENVCRQALSEARRLKGNYLMEIDPAAKAVIDSKDVTRKYILLTNVVAKLANPLIHSRALQATSSLNRPYNARTLCQTVIRPFVQESLNNCWGGQSDPLVNNPARHAEVSLENPCKSGLSRQVLGQLVEYLEKINSLKQDEIFKHLALILRYLLDSSTSRDSRSVRGLRGVGDGNIYAAAIRFVEKPLGGQSTALLADVCLDLIFSRVQGNFKVSSHPVNQSDASPHGILDSDVILGEESFLSVEVKDKSMVPTEIEAFKNKAYGRGLSNYGLVLGFHGNAPPSAINSIPTINIRSLISIAVLLLGPEFNRRFIEVIKNRIYTKGVSEACRSYAKECFNI